MTHNGLNVLFRAVLNQVNRFGLVSALHWMFASRGEGLDTLSERKSAGHASFCSNRYKALCTWRLELKVRPGKRMRRRGIRGA